MSFVYLFRCTFVTIQGAVIMNAILQYNNPTNIEGVESIFSQTQHLILSLGKNEREEFEERASIMEFEGGLSREEADWRALRIILENRMRIAV